MPKSFGLTRRALLGTGVLCASTPAWGQTSAIYKDRHAPIASRVKDLLARMTLEEKVAQLRVIWTGKFGLFDAEGLLSETKAKLPLANGIGQISRPSDTMGTMQFRIERHIDLGKSIPLANSIQRYLVEKTRLGIPVMFHDEMAHGLAARGATIFPNPTALASTWDPDLVEQVFTITAREGRLRGNTTALTPVLDLLRDPRFGRSDEMFSEDPWMTAKMGIAAVHGLQGRARPIAQDRVFATLKHFVHGSPEGGLNLSPAEATERSLRETYLVPFAQVIKAADPAWMMASYNEVGGVPAHSNADLLQRVGRDLLGFKGVYSSDYGGIMNLVDHHHVAENAQDATVMAINAGIDVDLSDARTFASLPELVKAGRVDIARIDEAVARVLALKFEAGLFENPYVDLRRAQRETNTPAAIKLARVVAQKAVILLKNDGVVPLEPATPIKLAVIGPNAVEPLFGGYSGENDKAVGILSGLRANAPANVTIDYAEGVVISVPDAKGRHLPRGKLVQPPESENRARIAAAVKVAQRSDVILLVVGDNAQITRESTQVTEPGDRETLSLFGLQDELVEAMLATGKPVIALLLNGRPLAVTRLAEKANALFEGWYLGQEGGNAFADILFGKANPGGKLTVSIPRSVGQLPVFYNHHPSEGLNSYIEGTRAPLYPFGYGLSYTSFEISQPRLSRATAGAQDTVSVDVEVTNTGKRSGDEVVQLYIRDEVSSVPRPVLELRAFRRVSLKPGASQTVRFDLGPDDLAFWDAAMTFRVEPGMFTISVGSSSVALKTAKLKIV